ncbi:hypothetical protein RSK20926_10914 [Roseobacter sp. SK209-2-6]|uniref:hypothetical protein n=1 Tax=Roseobacter sp. SK209-2-6 TaxID=388739 RepID=UPI0000F3C4E1|nr:hypothetical protein [Roseobacter sp. SK209-2-6]EBA18224.1 hypothetical protein RSK20926_10914 [Roseobacter sp. SK209-2-6]
MSVSKLMSLPVWTHRIAALASLGVMRLVQIRLDGLYAASGHPADYATGQTTFDAARVKELYAHMLDLGTLVARTRQPGS